MTSPSYVLHVRKGATRTLCGKRVGRRWMDGRTLVKFKCLTCERMDS